MTHLEAMGLTHWVSRTSQRLKPIIQEGIFVIQSGQDSIIEETVMYTVAVTGIQLQRLFKAGIRR
jgi:hypothetical protein